MLPLLLAPRAFGRIGMALGATLLVVLAISGFNIPCSYSFVMVDCCLSGMVFYGFSIFPWLVGTSILVYWSQVSFVGMENYFCSSFSLADQSQTH
jgi:uncharacterized RDD family membrane protein YckC